MNEIGDDVRGVGKENEPYHEPSNPLDCRGILPHRAREEPGRNGRNRGKKEIPGEEPESERARSRESEQEQGAAPTQQQHEKQQSSGMSAFMDAWSQA